MKKIKNNTAKVEKDIIQDNGIFPARAVNMVDVMDVSFGSSWKTAITGLFQLVSLKAIRPPFSREILLSPLFLPKLTTISFPSGGFCDSQQYAIPTLPALSDCMDCLFSWPK